MYPYSRNQVPRTSETVHPVPLPRNHLPCTLDTMHQKFGKKVEQVTHQCLKIKFNPLTFQHKNDVYCSYFKYPGWDMVF